MIGSHLSVAGGVHKAVEQAAAMGLECVQVFTKNQQQWSAPPMEERAVELWRRAMDAAGWSPETRAVSHASYLINLASDGELRRKSLALMRDEIERCRRLGIGTLVVHPGSAGGASGDGDRAAAMERVARACAELIAQTQGSGVRLCLENVAGAGSTLGGTLQELARMRARALELSPQPERLGVCLDTCHAHAAGYDLSTAGSAREWIDLALGTLGPGVVGALHCNDSKGAAGSRLDRHQHVGAGTIGWAGFWAVMHEPAWADLPMILETPKGTDAAGSDLDLLNAARLRALARCSSEQGPAALAAIPLQLGAPADRPSRPRPTPNPEPVARQRATAAEASQQTAEPPTKPSQPKPSQPKAKPRAKASASTPKGKARPPTGRAPAPKADAGKPGRGSRR
ncbi:MAG: deoxyribonuclease IV [Isosphaera sp.]|nr:deoxyribonuclease IV [Isosphaera sp.]